MKYLLISCWLIFIILLGGCNSGPDPQEVLAKSRDAMSELQSYRAIMNIVVNSDEGIQEARVFQEWANPDRWRMKFESLELGAGHFNEVVIVEGRLFTRESDSRKGAWREQTVGLDSQGLSRNAGDFVPTDLEGLKLMDDDVVDGVPVYQVTGQQVLVRAFPVAAPESPGPVQKEFVTLYTFLISKENFRVVRTITEQDLGPTSQRGTMDFYDYNRPVMIEMPEAAGE